MNEKKSTWAGSIAILFATLLWGMTFAFIKDAVTTLNPFTFLFWRFAIASIILLTCFYSKISLTRQNLLYGALLGILLAGTVTFQTIGLTYTTASTASFITGLSVILVAFFEAFLKGKWPSSSVLLAALLALIGIGMITLNDGFHINQGDLWVLLCAFCFAGYILTAGFCSKSNETFSLTFIQAILICLSSGLLSLLTHSFEMPSHSNVWIAILFCSIFASVIAFLLQLKFQKYISASKAAIIFALEPVFATITAAIYLHEQLSYQFYLGAACVLIAILIAER